MASRPVGGGTGHRAAGYDPHNGLDANMADELALRFIGLVFGAVTMAVALLAVVSVTNGIDARADNPTPAVAATTSGTG